MSGRSICSVILLAAAGLCSFAQDGGRAQEGDKPKPAVKRAVIFVKHGDAKQLAAVLAKHFDKDAEIQAVPANNYLLVRAEPAVVEEVAALLAKLDRRPRAVSVELFLLEVPPPKGKDGKEIDEKDFAGPEKEVLAKVEAHKAKGLVTVVRRLRLASLEGQQATVSARETVPQVTSVTRGGGFGKKGGDGGGFSTAQIHYRDLGTIVKVTALPAGEKSAVTLELEVDHSWVRRPEDGIVVGTDDKGKTHVAAEYHTLSVRSKVSVPAGQVVVVKDQREEQKAGQARALILATARVVEEGDGK
jgi:type II secretory pathway component GspD/PulD (secretin)